MKYVLGFTGSFLILCLLITTVIQPNMPDAQAQGQGQLSQQSEISAHSQTEISDEEIKKDNYEYILSQYKGVIAAYKNGQSYPVYISTVKISDLPKADRELLSNGIYAESRRKLNKLIEEYCS